MDLNLDLIVNPDVDVSVDADMNVDEAVGVGVDMNLLVNLNMRGNSPLDCSTTTPNFAVRPQRGIVRIRDSGESFRSESRSIFACR